MPTTGEYFKIEIRFLQAKGNSEAIKEVCHAGLFAFTSELFSMTLGCCSEGRVKIPY